MTAESNSPERSIERLDPAASQPGDFAASRVQSNVKLADTAL